ncbi:hypothetical protein [Paenibacillus sp. FSL K6-2862]|uniref:hypothetical protein n=1 Tax=Paenibacillus sp. FSL K6-2862 TaxID=2921484 RepID=UPI0030F92DA2
MGLFKQLFKDAQHGSEISIEPFQPGDVFPNQDYTENSIAIFLSLTCQDCIEVITAIQQASIEKLNGHHNLALYIVASEEEVKELDTYYDSRFIIHAISKKELVQKYRVPSTPYCYKRDNNNQVISSTEFDDLNSFMKTLFADYM